MPRSLGLDTSFHCNVVFAKNSNEFFFIVWEHQGLLVFICGEIHPVPEAQAEHIWQQGSVEPGVGGCFGNSVVTSGGHTA